jgi:hypothetical protein
MKPSRRASNLARLPAVLAAVVLALHLLVAPAPSVHAQDIDPRYLAVTDDEAGKQATRTMDQQGQDDRAAWVRLQWERNTEGPDALTGPWTVHSSVWVAQDFSTARAIYKEQADKNKSFPEAFFARGGTFPLPLPGVGTQSSGLSACFDCNVKDEIFLHHRAVVRWGVVVHVLYLYGPDAIAPADLLKWYLLQLQARVPESALNAPEKVGGPITNEAPAAPADARLVTANPKDIALRVEEVGKRAELKRQKDGKDARGSWYEVRYERGGTGSRFFEGPVTIYSYVHVAKDEEGAKGVYQDQIKLNSKFPEASGIGVGPPFGLEGGGAVGDESAGSSACVRTCQGDGDIFVHRRLVARTYNVVSLVYTYGQLVDEGNTDSAAVFLTETVVKRAIGE